MAAFGLSLCVAVPAHAATYYVSPPGGSPAGSDARSCGTAQTISTPKATINDALGCLSAGDTLLIRAGTYTQMLHTQVVAIPAGTSWSNMVHIKAYPGETVRLKPSGTDFVTYLGSAYHPRYIEFDGLIFDGADVISYTFKIESGPGYDADHIRAVNCEFIGPTNPIGSTGSTIIIYSSPGNESGAGFNEFINNRVHDGGRPTLNQDHGFYIGSSDNLFDGNDVYHSAGFSIHVWNHFVARGEMTTKPARNVIRNNRVHDSIVGSSTGGGILLGTDIDSQVYNNVVWNIQKTGGGTAGINAYISTSAQIYNNTVFGDALYGILVDSGSSGTIVRNNISYGNPSGDFVNSGGGTVQSNNLFGVNPLVVSLPSLPALTSSGDFHLQPTSPARNVGTNLTLVTTDATGAARPFEGITDIGAYEYRFGSALPAAPTGLRVVPE